MANSIYEATGDGSTTDFTIPYTYLEANDVTAFIGGVSTPFTFTSNNIVSFATAPANGASLRIVRNTDVDSLNVTYSDGGALTAEQLNDSNTQLLFGVQEAIDTANEAIILDNDGKFQGQVSSINRVIKNVANPVDPQDVATKDYLENTWFSPTDKTNLNTVASISSDVTTAAGISSDITAVASDATDIGVVSTNIASVNTNAGSIASINTNAANIADIQNASANATTATTKASEASGFADEAEAWAIKIDGEAVASEGYSSKAWAVGGTGVTDTAGAGAAKDWATETTGQVDGTEYSAKEYAVGAQASNTSGSAKQWSLGGGTGFDRDTAVTGSGLTAEYSARYWANQAANSAQDFVDVYYGSFTSDTAAEDYQINDNLGSVNVGDLYFNSSDNVMRVRSFSGWNDVAADTTSFATNGFAIAMAIAL